MRLLQLSLLALSAFVYIAHGKEEIIVAKNGLAIAPEIDSSKSASSPAAEAKKLKERDYYGYDYYYSFGAKVLVEKCRKEIIKRRGHGFCSQYLQPKTMTITKVVTRTKPGVTVVQTDTSTEVVTETTTEIVTETTTDVVTETSTTTVATTTATLPFEDRARALEKRYRPSIPYWLRSYDSDVIYAACSRVIKPPRTRTITRTRTKYVAGHRTTTVTTVPTTLTAFVPTTLTTTESTTTTTTTTASATETVTVPHPCNDLTTSSGRLYTNVIAAGIMQAPPNAYSWIENLSPRECCARCHDEPFRRCNIWMLFETSFQGTAFTCGLIYDYDGSSNTISDTCPKGTPDIWLVQDLGNGRPQNVGGPGVCHATIHTSI